jgi:hypothetical protein
VKYNRKTNGFRSSLGGLSDTSRPRRARRRGGVSSLFLLQARIVTCDALTEIDRFHQIVGAVISRRCGVVVGM